MALFASRRRVTGSQAIEENSMLTRSEPAVNRATVASKLNRRAGIRPCGIWLVPTAIAAVALGMTASGSGEGRVPLLTVAAAGCISCLAAYTAVGRLMPRYYVPRLLTVSYGVQLLALFAIAALGLPLSPPYHPFDVNAGDAPFKAVEAMLTVPAGTLIAAMAWRTVSRSSSRLLEELGPLDNIARQRRVYLLVAAVGMLTYWPAALENSGAIGYFGRILASALMVAPFLAGHDSRADRRLAALWSVVILVNAVVGIAAGTRSMAFIAAVLFGAGYVSALPRSRRLVVGACGGLAMMLLLQVAGALGVVRDELGRGGLELLGPDRVREMFDGILRQMTPGDQQSSQAVMLQGVGRLLAWTNVVVPIMTPESIPYRGFDGFLDEAAGTLRIASVSGLTVDDLLDIGLANAQARVYGFPVNSSTSVEFALAADGWSRGGAPVALLFSFIVALGLTAGEVCAFRLHQYGTGVATILALPAARAAVFDAPTYPLLPTLRSMVMYTLMVAGLVMIIESVRHVAHKIASQRFTSAPRAACGGSPGALRRPPTGIEVKT